jgi:muconate cycloisomerase
MNLTLPDNLPRPTELLLYRYRLPLRQRFEHATASRDVNEGILVRLRLADGSEGLGEGLPRPYVTGETIGSAVDIIRHEYAARLAGPSPLAAGPVEGSAMGVWHNAAWCACELAYLDACARSVRQPLAEFLGRALGRPVQRRIAPRVAGVIGSSGPEHVASQIFRMRLFGLRDFKLKIGLDNDRALLRAAYRRLKPLLARGTVTLRVDVNGVWSLDQALKAAAWLKNFKVAALEQPLRRGDEADLPLLRQQAQVPLMLDESLIDLAGARRLAATGAADYWNIRITKNGGLLQSLQLADLAAEHRIGLMLGALVGESGILSAAARVFLQLAPPVRFLENSYGSFLLKRDLVLQRTRFGYGGRIRPLAGHGLGVELNASALADLTELVARIPLT